jgi:hypothetical protein
MWPKVSCCFTSTTSRNAIQGLREKVSIPSHCVLRKTVIYTYGKVLCPMPYALQYMMGRSSRLRGFCRSIILPMTLTPPYASVAAKLTLYVVISYTALLFLLFPNLADLRLRASSSHTSFSTALTAKGATNQSVIALNMSGIGRPTKVEKNAGSNHAVDCLSRNGLLLAKLLLGWRWWC